MERLRFVEWRENVVWEMINGYPWISNTRSSIQVNYKFEVKFPFIEKKE